MNQSPDKQEIAFAEYQRQFNERGEIRVVGESAAWFLHFMSTAMRHEDLSARGDMVPITELEKLWAERAFENYIYKGEFDDLLIKYRGFSPTVMAPEIIAQYEAFAQILRAGDMFAEPISWPNISEHFHMAADTIDALCSYVGEQSGG